MLDATYASHIQTLQQRTRTALERSGLDHLLIHSGQLKKQFLDDLDYPFKVNPHFKAWLPVTDNPNSWLLVDGVNKPKLIFYRPVDFWHKVPDEPTDFWAEQFELIFLEQADQVFRFLPRDMAKTAYLGEHSEVAEALGVGHFNPDTVLSYLHYHRAYKTDYELACLREANKIAVAGHEAAEQAFLAGAAEFEIHQAFLDATQQSENELPYGNIIGLNEHGAILHYMCHERKKLAQPLSFLIDAGASYNGYAADITRTHSFHSEGIFAELLTAMTSLQKSLVEQVKAGQCYIELNEKAHLQLATLLQQFGFVKLAPQLQLETGITRTFLPHGLGHFLGLQVHDVGGFMADERGTYRAAPELYPALRLTRSLEARQVITIEPGLYFIDSLLAELKAGPLSAQVNWSLVDKMRPYGGIRIEDNVIVGRTSSENMTRNLGLK